ncbi:MAG: hypothetical protein IPN92_00095 [Chromatiaceae bacterium]|nr:hypothetical protein [Chromatiaceae bacterium]
MAIDTDELLGRIKVLEAELEAEISQRQADFRDFGDAEAYRKELDELRKPGRGAGGHGMVWRERLADSPSRPVPHPGTARCESRPS